MANQELVERALLRIGDDAARAAERAVFKLNMDALRCGCYGSHLLPVACDKIVGEIFDEALVDITRSAIHTPSYAQDGIAAPLERAGRMFIDEITSWEKDRNDEGKLSENVGQQVDRLRNVLIEKLYRVMEDLGNRMLEEVPLRMARTTGVIARRTG